MGYTTDFSGALTIEPHIRPEHAAYLNEFSDTRRMKRYPGVAAGLPDELRQAVGLPVGLDGGYFVGGGGLCGQDRDESVADFNTPPSGQPGLWCQWVVNESESLLEWNQAEKFYYYTLWLEYLVDHFFKPWGYTLNGEISWQGEEPDDQGIIHVEDNMVEEVPNKVINPGPSWRRSSVDSQ